MITRLRALGLRSAVWLTTSMGLTACIDPYQPELHSALNVLVVDGTITNLEEPQVIRLNRSGADAVTGLLASTPVTKAKVAVVVDSVDVVSAPETTTGRYQLPADFRGKAGHVYQLKLTLSDGTRYESTPEQLQPVAPISQVSALFNPTSLRGTERLNNIYAAAHDFYVDFTDPADQTNYYRWEWVDWERQEWCRSCIKGLYQINDGQGNLLEDCVNNTLNASFPNYDYNCRTDCWEILHSRNLILFDDRYSNGNPVKGLLIGQIPLYSKAHCLVEIRQSSLTKKAYDYLYRLNDQSQNTGGVAGGQPAVLVGNVHNVAQRNEPVVGYFIVSSVSSVRYWLTRRDASGFFPLAYFRPLKGMTPLTSPLWVIGPQQPSVFPADSRTPNKPTGWLD